MGFLRSFTTEKLKPMNRILRNSDKNGNIKSINLLIIALTIHIFSVHCRLLYYLNPEVDKPPPFSIMNLNEPTILAMVFAVAYSLATVWVITRAKKKGLIFIFAVLDSIGVLLYYFTEIPLQCGAVYFAIYTGALILSTIYLDRPEYLSDQIQEMKQKGISQREIAQQMQMSESMVSRLLKRVKNHNGTLARTNGSLG